MPPSALAAVIFPSVWREWKAKARQPTLPHLNRMADNIQMNDNSRGQFMGNIAHELRTP